MTRTRVNRQIVAGRALWIRKMLEELRALPLGDRAAFFAESRNAASTESYLRRALEALLDLGRHVVVKEFAEPADESKEIVRALTRRGILEGEVAEAALQMAGYRNRMVHFYSEISADELFDICSSRLGDVERVTDAILSWLKARATVSD